MKKVFVIIIACLYFNSVVAQDISNIIISPDQKYFTFLKDKDSLYIKEINNKKEPSLIQSGFKNDFNERFLMWNPHNSELMFENKKKIYQYNPVKGTLKNHNLPDSLQLFKYFRINQACVSKSNKLYFSAFYPEDDFKSRLFELDLTTGELIKVVSEEFDIGNVNVSKNGKLIAYSFYQSSYDSNESSIKVIDSETKEVVFQKKYPGKSFLSNIYFIDENHLFHRNVYGQNHIVNYNLQNDSLSSVGYPTDVFGYFLYPVSDREVLTLKINNDERVYSLFNIENEEKLDVLIGKNVRVIDVNKNGDNYDLFITDENGNTPKTLKKKSISKSGQIQEELIYSFVEDNILKDVNYSIFNYTNKAGSKNEAHLYFPAKHILKNDLIPMIIMVYGGYDDTYPQMSYFMNNIFFDYLKKGYALAFLNTRGYADRRLGNHYGKTQLEDTEVFLSEVIKEFKVSKHNVILAGHSHGATMVYYYLTHSNKFAGGIAVNGAADWIEQARLKSMTGLPGEMGGAPDTLLSKYNAYSPLENISQQMAPILIIAGQNDTQIPIEINSMAFHERALSTGVKSQFYHFEDEGHLIIKPENLLSMKKQISEFIEMLTDKE